MVNDESKGEVPSSDSVDPSTEIEIQRSINEIKSEVLDYQTRRVNRWLNFIAIALSFFGIVVVIGGFFGLQVFREIANDAREIANDARVSAKEAKELVKEIKMYRDQTKAIRDKTAESFAMATKRQRQAVENVLEDPQSTLIDKAIAEAFLLQAENKKGEAIEKWRTISMIAEGSDDNLAARAWFSVGFLLRQQKNYEEAINAFNQALRLNSTLPEAYNNRGNAKAKLGRYDVAIKDYDKALFLKPNYVIAYYNRGTAKRKLKQYAAAVADFDEAIDLKPDYAEAHNNRGAAKFGLGQYEAAIVDYNKGLRLGFDKAKAYYNLGEAKTKLGRKSEARSDFTTAINLARQKGNQEIIKLAERELKKLDEQ